jgi:hypothetical protein
VLQSSGVPEQAPAELHWSTEVHGSPSSQLAPPGLSEYEQAPFVHVPAGSWHWLGGVVHVRPMQGSWLQSPLAASQPNWHTVSVCGVSQVPLAAWHVPATNEREVTESRQVGPPAVQLTVEPAQVPLPSHWSVEVQATPSVQVVPCARG